MVAHPARFCVWPLIVYAINFGYIISSFHARCVAGRCQRVRSLRPIGPYRSSGYVSYGALFSFLDLCIYNKGVRSTNITLTNPVRPPSLFWSVGGHRDTHGEAGKGRMAVSTNRRL